MMAMSYFMQVAVGTIATFIAVPIIIAAYYIWKIYTEKKQLEEEFDREQESKRHQA